MISTVAPVVTGGGTSLGSAAAGPIGAVVGGFQLARSGQGHVNANTWNTQFHGPLWQQFVQIANDPNHTKEQVAQWWTKYLAAADQFSRTDPTVVGQALSTPAFTSSVERLWTQLGGQGGLNGLNQIVASQGGSSGQSFGWSILTQMPWLIKILPGIDKGGNPRGVPADRGPGSGPSTNPTNPNGTNPNGGDPSLGGASTQGPQTTAPSGGDSGPALPGDSSTGAQPPTGGDSGPGLPGDPSTGTQPKKPDGVSQSLWNKILPYLTAGTGLASSLYGMFAGASTAKDAAKLQADAYTHASDLTAKAAADTLDFQKGVYADSIKRSQPWVDSGTGALGMLNTLTGNPSGPQNTNIDPRSVQMMPLSAAVNYNGTVAQPPTQPAARPNPQAPFAGLRRVTI